MKRSLSDKLELPDDYYKAKACFEYAKTANRIDFLATIATMLDLFAMYNHLTRADDIHIMATLIEMREMIPAEEDDE